jgi:hypothetical protein
MHAQTVTGDAQPVSPSRAPAGEWPQMAATGLLAALLVALAFADGGYFPAAYTLAGAVAFAAVGLLVLVRPPRLETPALVALAALAAFAAWSGISAGWSLVADAPSLDMQRSLLYVALLALGLLASTGQRGAGLLVWSVLGVVAIVVGTGLLSRLQPDLVAGAVVAPGTVDVRLSYPLGYWNAFGALATIAGVLAIGLAADPRAARVLRAGAAGLAVLALVAMYLSLSRGAWLAFVAAVVVLIALSRHRGTLLASLAIVGAGAVVALLALRSYPALVDGPRPPGAHEAQGDAYTARLIIVVLLAVAAQAVATAPAVVAPATALLARVRGPLIAATCAVALLGGVAGLALKGGDAASWVSSQWDDFSSPDAPLPAQGTSRLTSAGSSRSATYRVALDAFAAQPLHGEGAGSYEVRWMRTRTLDDKLRDAHSLPLQTLAELGLAGLALLAAFAGAVLLALWRSIRRCGVLRRSQAAAVGAAFCAWLVHASIDWDWEMPALTGVAIVLSATLFARDREAVRA